MAINNLGAVQKYIEQSLPIIPLAEGRKIPVLKEWSKYENGVPMKEFAPENNIGLLLGGKLKDGYYLHAIDFDLTGDELQDWVDNLTTHLGIDESNAVYQESASKSLHFFVKLKEPLDKMVYRIAFQQRDEKGDVLSPGKQIELLGKGQQVVLAPSVARGKDKKWRMYDLTGEIIDAPVIDVEKLKEFFLREDPAGIEASDKTNDHQVKALPQRKGTDNQLKYKKESYALAKTYELEDVLNKLEIRYKRHGQILKILCPYHPEKTESFVLFKENGLGYDFHDSRKVSIIEIISDIRKEGWRDFLKANFPIVTINREEENQTGDNSRLSIRDLIKVNGEEIIYKKYISEKNSDLERIIRDEFNYNLIAATGSGKNHAIINKLKELKRKTIFFSPYESTVKQLSLKYDVPGIWGEIQLEDVREAIEENNFIVSTYDGFSKIQKILTDFELSFYVAVIDEYHNFITQMSFRSKAIMDVIRHLSFFRKVITMTGTPEGIISNDYRTVIFRKENEPRIIKNYQIIEYKKKMGVESLLTHIINHPVKGKTVVFKNDINDLHIIKNSLINKGISEDEIALLSSKNKSDDIYSEITDNEQITSRVRYLLTTSVISDGVNILNENISAVYLLDVADLIQLRQFIARFRKGCENVYDFIKNNDEKTPEWIDINKITQERIEFYKKIAGASEEYLLRAGLKDNSSKVGLLDPVLKDLTDEHKFLYVDSLTGVIKVNENKVRLYALNELYSITIRSGQRRKEYLEAFGYNIEVNIIKDKTKELVDIGLEKEQVQELNGEIWENIINLLNERKVEVITTYLKEINKKLYKEEKEALRKLIDEKFDTNSFYLSNRELFNTKITDKVLLRYIRFYKLKIPHDLILKIVDSDPRVLNRFEERIKIKRMFWMYNNAREILPYTKKSLDIVNFRILIFILQELADKNFFKPEELYKRFNSVSRQIGLAVKMRQEQIVQAISDVFLLERVQKTEKVGNRKKTVTLGYTVHGLLTYAKILEDLELKSIAEYQSAVENAAEAWCKERISYLYGKMLQNGKQIPEELIQMFQDLGVRTVKTGAKINLNDLVTHYLNNSIYNNELVCDLVTDHTEEPPALAA